MIYQVNFNRDQLIDPMEFHKFIVSIHGVISWWHYLPSTYLLSGSNLTAHKIQQDIHLKYPELPLLISKFSSDDNDGFLPRDAWDWIDDNKQSLKSIKELLEAAKQISDQKKMRSNTKLIEEILRIGKKE